MTSRREFLALCGLMTFVKHLQMFVAAPIAPKTEETFNALKSLHPESPLPDLPPPTHDAPRFTDQHVREALFSFTPTSAAGLFGYRPSIFQQCARQGEEFRCGLSGRG